MTTRQELEKIVEEKVQIYVKPNSHPFNEHRYLAFKSGAAFVMDKLMPELNAANERIKELENECSRLSDCCHLLDSSLRRLLKQPFHGSWDAQSVYIQHILHEARNWKALTPPERGEE